MLFRESDLLTARFGSGYEPSKEGSADQETSRVHGGYFTAVDGQQRGGGAGGGRPANLFSWLVMAMNIVLFRVSVWLYRKAAKISGPSG